MITYSRPRLITEDDKYYRAYVESFKLQRKNQKAMRPPRQRDLFGAEAEPPCAHGSASVSNSTSGASWPTKSGATSAG